MKLLVIEADPEISGLISLAFCVGRPKTEIIAVSSADCGVELACDAGVDLVVVDLGLEHKSGFKVIRDIRLYSKVPMIVVADLNTRNLVSDAMKLGANECLVKPFELMEILGKVCGLVEKKGIKYQQHPLPDENKVKQSPPKYVGFVQKGQKPKTDWVGTFS